MMPIFTLKKVGKNRLDLVSTNMKMTNFTGDMMANIGLSMANIIVGPKTLGLAFFVIDGNPSYFMLLRRDWIHPNQSVSSTLLQLLYSNQLISSILHQLLMF